MVQTRPSSIDELADNVSVTIKLNAEEYKDLPHVRSRDIVLTDLEYRPITSTRTLGKYRIQSNDLGDQGPVFILTLFGSTCSKLRLVLWWRELTELDHIRAMQGAIEREIGYNQNSDIERPIGAVRPIDIIIRDTDFLTSAPSKLNVINTPRRYHNEHHS